MKSIFWLTPARIFTIRSQTRKIATRVLPLVGCICIALWACGSSRDAESSETPGAEPAAMAAAETGQPQTSEAPADIQPPGATPTNVETGAKESSPASGSLTDSMDHVVTYGDTVWAPGKEQKLMLGLDNGLYEPYRASVVREAQQQLSSQGFYDGPVSGVIDERTMEALGKFQKENGLQASGVPTPLTREALFGEPAGDEVS